MVDRQMVERWLGELYEATAASAFFDRPFLKVASASDPLWETFRHIIGPFHWTPQEALIEEHPGATAASVIVYILPILEQTCRDNRAESTRPSRSWARTRSFGEEANVQIRQQLALLLSSAGHPAGAPHLTQTRLKFDMIHSGYVSRFSERHAAFVAGLGTFGLSGGLITERGIAHRIGAIVTALELEPDSRPYGDDPYAWCTQCGACIGRCPAGSVGRQFADRDKAKCFRYVYEKIQVDQARNYGFLNMSIGCGLCQTGVPCESARPQMTAAAAMAR